MDARLCILTLSFLYVAREMGRNPEIETDRVFYSPPSTNHIQFASIKYNEMRCKQLHIILFTRVATFC